MTLTEEGSLLIGVEYNGARQKAFELRPQIVKDVMEAMEDERTKGNETFLTVCVFSKIITKLGEIPKDKITPDIILGMAEADFEVLEEARQRLEKRIRSFRKDGGKIQGTGAGA
jgi:hypothetical protein